MLYVEIFPIQDTLVLRARGSELLIMAPHVKELKERKTPQEFSNYFMTKALINRPARKLFEAWLRKDRSLWPRIYKTIQEEMTLSSNEGSGEIQEQAAPVPAEKSSEKSPEKSVEKPKAEPSKPPKKEEVQLTPPVHHEAKMDVQPKVGTESSKGKHAPVTKQETPSKQEKPKEKVSPVKAKEPEKKPAKSESKKEEKPSAKGAKTVKKPESKPSAKEEKSKTASKSKSKGKG